MLSRAQAASLLALAAALAAASAAAAAPGAAGDDRELARAVGERLAADPELASVRLDVHVEDGVAHLSGTVPRLRLAWRAERLAGRVRGLRDVRSSIGVATGRRDDERIAEEIRAAFRQRPRLADAGLRVTVERGRARLEGELADPRTRFIARDAAASVRGVVAVEDALTTAPRPDDELERQLRELLAPTPYRPFAGRIDFDVEEGRVTLTGRVPRVIDRVRAVEAVLGVAGVQEVTSDLAVAPPSDDVPVVRP